jgi:hypothetical protein
LVLYTGKWNGDGELPRIGEHMRYQVEIDGEAVAVFEMLSWAKKWAQDYHESFLLHTKFPKKFAIVVVDVINDNVLETWEV